MFGILNIDKPAGVTSRDVVTRVVRQFRQATGQKIKVGHAGTLDPMASGVLILAVGKATRLIQYIQRRPKTYQATFRVDCTSESADLETELQALAVPSRPQLADLQEVLPEFLGTILQVPPAYSAISIAGQRAYKLARRGIEVNLEPRQIVIHDLQVESYRYPELKMRIECGSGTYIRSLGRDIAKRLDSDAVMTDLVRTCIGTHHLEEALSFVSLDFETLVAGLTDPLLVVDFMPKLALSLEERDRIRTGRFIEWPAAFRQATQIAATDSQGRLVAILEPRGDQLKPVFNLGDGLFPQSG